MQAVEERDQVEGPRIILGRGALEDGAIGDTRFARYFAGSVDRNSEPTGPVTWDIDRMVSVVT